jgi:hypothetical protein
MESLLAGLVEVFNWVVQTSIYAAVIIVVIATVQKLVRHRLPARWSYVLWMIGFAGSNGAADKYTELLERMEFCAANNRKIQYGYIHSERG